jgi:hypothetical protein
MINGGYHSCASLHCGNGTWRGNLL